MLSCVCCVRREGEGEIRSAIRSAQCAMGRRSAWTTRQRRRAALRELRSCAAGAAAARGTHAAQEEVVQHVVEVTQSEKMVALVKHLLFAFHFPETSLPVAAQGLKNRRHFGLYVHTTPVMCTPLPVIYTTRHASRTTVGGVPSNKPPHSLHSPGTHVKRGRH